MLLASGINLTSVFFKLSYPSARSRDKSAVKCTGVGGSSQ